MYEMKETLNKLFRLITRRLKIRMIALVAFMIIVAIIDTLSTVMMLPLMYALIDETQVDESSWQNVLYCMLNSNNRDDYITKVSILLLALYMVRGISLIVLTWRQQRFAADNRSILARRLFRCLVYKPYAYYLQHSTAEIQFQVTTDINMVNNILLSILTIISEIMLTVMILIMMTVISPILMAVSVVLLIIILILSNFLLRKHVIKIGKRVRNTGTEVNKWIYQTTGAFKGIVVNKKQPFFIEKFANATKESAGAVAINETLSILPGVMVETASLGAVFLAMALFSYFGGNAKNVLPIVATFAIAIVKLMPSMKKVGSSLTSIQYNTPSLRALYQLIDDNFYKEEKYWGQLSELETSHVKQTELQGKIKIKNITFKFKDAEKPLFENVSFEIPIGKSVAFVGATGAGKTTLADIILGLHIPDEGKVVVNNIDIHKEPIWWADKIGYIPQQIYLCDDTIKNNVAMGIEEKDIDEETVWDCLKNAQIDEFVKGLPDGLNTITGEAGIRLSGGQKQRIGIARALYYNPQFLVLDEATSALDHDTEKAIMEVIDNLAGKKTVLIIAHRLSTIRNCDIVYRIENGLVYKEVNGSVKPG